jgi:hypothetical protein
MVKKQLKAMVKGSNDIYPVIEFAFYDFVKVRSYYGNVVLYDWEMVDLVVVYEDE